MSEYSWKSHSRSTTKEQYNVISNAEAASAEY